MNHQQHPPGERTPDQEKASFGFRVVRIVVHARQGIEENRCSFFETNAMSARILSRFAFIPGESEVSEGVALHDVTVPGVPPWLGSTRQGDAVSAGHDVKDRDAAFHEKWLGLARPIEGLVFSVPVLADAQIAPELRTELSVAFAEQLDAG